MCEVPSPYKEELQQRKKCVCSNTHRGIFHLTRWYGQVTASDLLVLKIRLGRHACTILILESVVTYQTEFFTMQSSVLCSLYT